jgi:ketosteroid isomerase-like protein
MADPRMELLREVLAEWEQGDFRRTDCFTPDYEFVFARDFLDSAEYRGVEDVSRGWHTWLDQWSFWRVIPLEFYPADDRIGVRIMVEGTSKSSGLALSQESGTVFDFRDGVPCRITVYTRWQTMFEDLGLEAS